MNVKELLEALLTEMDSNIHDLPPAEQQHAKGMIIRARGELAGLYRDRELLDALRTRLRDPLDFL